MITQKKYYAALLLSMGILSYGMDKYFSNEEKKNIHPLTRCVIYTQHQIEELSRSMKVENNKQNLQSDKVFISSGGSFRTVRTYGPIVFVEKIPQKLDDQTESLRAKL